ncbi:ABC transporter permease [Bacillus sp. AFS041924]|uniref:ABC transporter permease n=1 Tax=Bacillus sp. AFS041924 TaxID=2033503 RepID=UPI000BFD1618|nr:ABC transporter permease [Bacillus sp. AFS041924]PGS49871.1 teichoic acid ABC transporter permease [Bacillus sp. AFS041924]
MNSLKTVFSEQFNNVYMIGRLSAYELKKLYANSFLGGIWIILNPIIQIAVYGVTFGLGIRGGRPIDGIPYFTWMICGLIPWFFISASIMQGSNAIYNRINTVARMNFPLSITPTYVIVAQLYTHLVLLILLITIVSITVGIGNIHLIELLYYIFASFCFLLSLSFITSTLSTMMRDIHLLIQQATRMLLYLTPVLWEASEHAPKFLLDLMKLNPFFYVVEGYRSALIYDNFNYLLSPLTAYFWGLVVIMLIVGTTLHVKFRRNFVDYL